VLGPRGAADALARCGCDRCVGELTRVLRPYTATVIGHVGVPAGWDFEDAEQHAFFALRDALAKWEQQGPFAAFYGAFVKHYLLRASAATRAAKRRAMLEPLSLSATDDSDEEPSWWLASDPARIVGERNEAVATAQRIAEGLAELSDAERDAVLRPLRQHVDPSVALRGGDWQRAESARTKLSGVLSS
jgi:DNA-directed RNA polymerase specialized sigma24 family protein